LARGNIFAVPTSYDEKLSARVRTSIEGKGRIEERMAFGGLTFMLDGKMCVGVEKTRLMVRIDPAKHDALIARPGAGPMDFTGRPMRGFLWVDARGLPNSGTLDFWVNESVAFVRTVPARTKKKKEPAGAPRKAKPARKPSKRPPR